LYNKSDIAIELTIKRGTAKKSADLVVFKEGAKHKQENALIIVEAKGGSERAVRERVAARVKDLCSHNLYGLDINPFLVRTCQMNLVMHGDGSANVFRADSL